MVGFFVSKWIYKIGIILTGIATNIYWWKKIMAKLVYGNVKWINEGKNLDIFSYFLYLLLKKCILYYSCYVGNYLLVTKQILQNGNLKLIR